MKVTVRSWGNGLDQIKEITEFPFDWECPKCGYTHTIAEKMVARFPDGEEVTLESTSFCCRTIDSPFGCGLRHEIKYDNGDT